MEDPVQDLPALIHTLTQSTPSAQKAALTRYFTPTASFTHPFCATGSWSYELAFFGSEYRLTSRWAILQIYQWYKIISPEIEIEVESVTFNEKQMVVYAEIRQRFRLWFVPGYDAHVRLTTVLKVKEGDGSGCESVARREFEERYRCGGGTGYGGGSRGRSNNRVKDGHSYAEVANPEKDTEINEGENTEGVTSTKVVRRNGVRSRSTNTQEVQQTKKLYYIVSQEDLYQTSEWIKFLSPWGIGSTLLIAWQLFATLLSILGAGLLFPVTWWKERSVLDLPKKI